MSSAANHRKRSHRSHSKHYSAGRTMTAYAESRKAVQENMLQRFFRGVFGRNRRESRNDLEGGDA